MTPTLPTTIASPLARSPEVSAWQVETNDLLRRFWEGKLPKEAFVLTDQFEFHQHFNIPIQFNYAFLSHLSPEIECIGTEVREVVVILGRHESILNRHEEMLQEILATVRENALLNADPTDTAADAAEAQLREIVTIIQEGRTLPPPDPEIDAMLSRAIERRATPPTDSAEEWTRKLAASVSHLTD